MQPFAQQFLTLLHKCYLMIDDMVKPADKQVFFFTHLFKPTEDERLKEVEAMFKRNSMLLNQASKTMIKLFRD